MKKIALLTPFDTGNYGTVLQAYATQYMLEMCGMKCIVLNYHYNAIQNPFKLSNLRKREVRFWDKMEANLYRMFTESDYMELLIPLHYTEVTFRQINEILSYRDEIGIHMGGIEQVVYLSDYNVYGRVAV